MRGKLWVLTGAVVAVVARDSMAIRITTEVRTEKSVPQVTLRVFGRGGRLPADPALFTRPLAETSGPTGRLELELPDASLPLSVEVVAPGHLAATAQVLVPRQTTLPPVWLPAGKALAVRVTSGAGPVPQAGVWGTLDSPVPSIPGRWAATLATTRADGSGKVTLTLPADGSANVFCQAPDGRWGEHDVEARVTADVACKLSSRTQLVVVRNPRGEPLQDVQVVPNESSITSGARTGADGRASLQVPGEGSFTLLGVGQGCAARAFFNAGSPRPELSLVCEPLHTLRVAWDPSSPEVFVRPSWVPAGLRGATWLMLQGGAGELPLWGQGGEVEAWAPGMACTRLGLEEGQETLSLRLKAAARIDGTVVGPDDRPVTLLPVWGWLPPRWASTLPGGRPMSADMLQRLPLPLAVAGDTGQFEVPGLTPGLARLVARQTGRTPGDSGPLELAAGEQRVVTLRLGAGTWLQVQITDTEARPVPGASVRLLANPGGRSRTMVFRFGRSARNEEPLATGSTDREGRLTLDAVPPGPGRLVVSAKGYVRKSVEVEIPEAGLDAGTVTLDPGVTVQGRVVDEKGTPVPDAEVQSSDMPMPGFGNPAARTDVAGGFAIEDQPRSGELFLSARAQGFVASEPVKVALPPAGLAELRMRRGRVLEGRVVDEATTAAVANATVNASKNSERSMGGGGMTIRMMSVTGGPDVETDTEGRFRIEDLAPGSYDLKVKARGYRESRVSVGIPESEPLRPVTVPLKAGLRLQGKVIDNTGAPVPAVHVTAEPASSSDEAFRPGEQEVSTRSGEDGSFLLESLAPGRAVVSARSEDGATAREVVEAGRQEPVELRLEGAGALQGRVVTEQGDVPADIEIQGWGETSRSGLGEIPVQPDGSFAVERVTPGQYQISAAAPGWSRASESVSVASDRTSQVTLTLKRGGTITGRVLGLGGPELERCQVFASGSRAKPSPDGSFTLTGVRLGRTEVAALLVPDGKRRSASADIKEVDVPVTVELDFGKGITLSGTVRRAGAPAANVALDARAGKTGASTVTDPQGAWEIPGLEPGVIELRVSDQQGRDYLRRRLEASSDLRVDLEVPGGVLRGRAVSMPDRQPLAGARIKLAGAGDGAGLTREATTDERGGFRIEELPDGTFTVRAEASGYSSGEASARLAMGTGQEVTVELTAEKRLVLQVRLEDGSVPDRVNLLPLRNGRVENGLWADCDRQGEVTFTSIPAGGFTATVWASGGAALGMFTVPGGPTPVVLRRTGSLRLHTATPSCRVRVVATGTGLVVPVSAWQNPSRGEWFEVAGSSVLQLPPGFYQVQVTPGASGAEPVTVQVTPDGDVTAEVCAP